MEIVRLHIPRRVNAPGTAIVPKELILHYIGNPGTTARQNASYFAHVNSQTSVHYIVDDGEIIEIIPPDQKSYGTSSREHNERGIQIEMCHPDASGRIEEAVLEKVVWLCRELMDRYGITEIIRHYDVTGKRCPAPMVDNPTLWENFLNLLEDRTMTYAEAIEIVKEKAGLSDGTMQFLTSYIWREDLLKKLAQAMK